MVSFNGNSRIVSLTFANFLYGYALTYNGTVMHTVDGGNSWYTIYNSLPNHTGTEIKYTGDSCIVATGFYNSGNLLYSCDNGQTWTIDSLHNFSLNLTTSLDLINDSSWIVIDQYANIFITHNYGYDWQNISIGSDGGSSIQAVNDSIFMAIGCEPNCAFCFNSSFDSGNSWINSGQPTGVDLYFFSNGTGHIIRGCGGGGPVISYTNDFGNTFVDTYNSNSYDTVLTSIEFASLNIGYATGTNGVIVKTVTGGTTTVSEISNTETILYPNPFDQFINFETKSEQQFILFDQFGRIIIQELIKKNKILDTSDFSTGIYFYKIVSENGITAFGKLIKPF